MEDIVKRKIILWILLSINLTTALIVGLFISSAGSIGIALGVLNISAQIVLIFFVIGFLDKNAISLISKKRIAIWVILTLNLLFAFLIGLKFSLMETRIDIRYNMIYILLPLLIILNYIIIDRLHYYIKHSKGDNEALMNNSLKNNNTSLFKNRPIIEFEGKKYVFSIRSILILAIGAPILSFATYLFFDTEANYWLHEIVVTQTVFFLNLLFNMNASAKYNPDGKYHWSFVIPGRGEIFFETFCTGIQAIVVFFGIILCTPHSLDRATNEDIVWRKAKALVISSLIFYVVNIIRMVIQIYLFYIGYAWVDIHYSISAASSFVAAIIVLLMHKYIPEFIISIIYTGTLISKKMKGKKTVENNLNK